jgi:hypothetical protein
MPPWLERPPDRPGATIGQVSRDRSAWFGELTAANADFTVAGQTHSAFAAHFREFVRSDRAVARNRTRWVDLDENRIRTQNYFPLNSPVSAVHCARRRSGPKPGGYPEGTSIALHFSVFSWNNRSR